MPVDSRHPEYAATMSAWQRVRDVIAGEDAVKARGTDYLPKVGGQTAEKYDAYRNRATFHEATARTVDGLVGAIFRKPSVVEMPAAFEPLLENVTQRGAPFEPFAKAVAEQVIAVGRQGILVDMPPGAGAGTSAYLCAYDAEAIINWRTETVAGRPKLTLVVLAECETRPKPNDPFETDDIEICRVLRLGTVGDDAPGTAPRYIVDVWEKQTGTAGRREEWVLRETVVPVRRGAPLDFIPFVFIGPTELDPCPAKPPMLALANVNLSHYRTSADIEHGAHYTALPTPWVAGAMIAAEGQTQLEIGAGVAWMLEKDASVGMLEYNGTGLDALEKRLARKEAHMAVLGARLLEDQKASAETAETVRLRHRGENSLLASIADTIGRGLTQALNWAIWWQAGPDAAATVALNTDFFDADMSAQDIVALVDAWQRGGVGMRTLFHNLQAGERLPPEMDYDAFVADIEETGPAALGLLPRAEPMPGEGGDGGQDTMGGGMARDDEDMPADRP